MHAIVRSLLALVAPSRCAACDELVESEACLCGTCLALVDRSSRAGAAFEYGGPVADAIRRLKYEGRSDLAERLGALMATDALRFAGRVDAVVPVPLHWRRRRARGYDQAALLARPLARVLVVPALLRGLRRVRHTPSQVGLGRAARRRNVEGAFAPARLHGVQRVLLVDDVQTSGATLASAEEALRAGGVAEVHTLVLAARLLDGDA